MYKNILKLSAGLLLAAGMTAGPAMAGGEAEVLHWWTSASPQWSPNNCQRQKWRNLERHAGCRWRR